MARKGEKLFADKGDDTSARHLCRCVYQGARCQFFWVVSDATNGGPGLCNRHADLERAGEHDYALRYAQIVLDSEVWAIAQAKRKVEAEATGKPFHPGVGGRQAEAFLQAMRKALNAPHWSPREHWEGVLEHAKPGSLSHQYAVAALNRLGARSREPGEDDEEKAA